MEPKDIKADAFKINDELLNLKDGNIVDYDIVKVKEMIWKQFKLKNTGIYKIRYKF